MDAILFRRAATLKLIVFSFIPISICKGVIVHSEAYGYQIAIPQGWVEIPDDVLKETFAKILNAEAQKRIVQDKGFQLDSSEDWLEYPYVLVQPILYSRFGRSSQINEDEFLEFVRALTGLNTDNVVNNALSKDAGDILENVAAGMAELDSSNRRFFWHMKMTVKDVGQVRGLVCGYFGRNSLVQVSFYAKSDDWDKYKVVRKAFLDSFRFDSGSAYSVELAKASSRSIFSGAWERVSAVAIVAAVGVIIKMAIKRKSPRWSRWLHLDRD